MTTDLKTSLLVNRQVPEFVREEHPNFIAFLEAYYEFLQEKQGTQINDLITQAKNLRYVADVDSSIAAFQRSFINNYASLIPQDALVDKDFLIKNVLPLYLSRGNVKSFELLFRLLYGKEVSITYPKDNILRASAGNWVVENVVRIDNDVYSYYEGNGITKIFFLAQQATESDVTVFVNDVATTSGFYILKESKKIIFDTAPVDGAKIRVLYDDFDETLFTNRKITGLTSGATAIVERAAPRLITQQTSIELYIDAASLLGNFVNAETVVADIFADDGTTLISIRSDTVATLSSITVTNGGASYNVGDPVTIIGGAPQTQAEAVVDAVASGFVDTTNVHFGAAGFQAGGIINGTDGIGGVVTAAIVTVDDSGATSANSFTIFTDVIDTYANVLISASDYGFPANVIPTGENVATRLIDAFSKGTITGIGPVSSFTILFANTSSPNTTILDADGAKIETLANTFIDIKTFGSLGRIRINNGGTGYRIGDEITFGANPPSTYGVGAAAAVTSVNTAGSITKVEFQPSRISGSANTTSGSIIVTGNGTAFTSELSVGDQIMINSEARYVNSITSATSLNVNVAFSRTSTERKIGLYDQYLVGGQGYTQNNFPTISVSSANTLATGANLQIVALMGDGEQLSVSANTIAGEIQRIKITNPGAGYQFIPTIDLSNYGNGSATAEAQIERSYISFSGKWVGSDGIISSFDRKLEGLDYYIDFTYLTSVEAEFSKYKEILKGLLHPAGFKNYAEYPIQESVDLDLSVSASKSLSVSGTVSTTNGSITVTGTSTRFNVANSTGIISVGSQISINNQIRTINSIISNTSLTVSSAFTNNSSAQTLIIIT